MKKLVLFDIDGTLLWSDGAGRSAIRSAMLAEMGTAGPIDGYRFDGKTDPQIVSELLEAANHPDASSERHIADVCGRYLSLLQTELESDDRSIRVLKGAAELLSQLETRSDVLLGLLTGNIREGASLKLTAAGLDPQRFRVGAYGSDSARRERLPAIAAARAEPLMGFAPRDDALVIIGDTPADVTCGSALRARAIGVATGSYSVDELRAAGAYAVFTDLADSGPVVDAIFG